MIKVRLFLLIVLTSIFLSGCCSCCWPWNCKKEPPLWNGTGFSPYLTVDAQGNPWISYIGGYVSGGAISQINIAHKVQNQWIILTIPNTNNDAVSNRLFINNHDTPVLVYFDGYKQDYKILTSNNNAWTSQQFTPSTCATIYDTCSLQWGGTNKTLPPAMLDNSNELWIGTGCGVAIVNGITPLCFNFVTPAGTEGFLVHDAYGNPFVGLLNNDNLDFVTFTNTTGNWVSTITYTTLNFTSSCSAWVNLTNPIDKWNGNTNFLVDNQNNPIFVNQGQMNQISSNMCLSRFTNNTWNTAYLQWTSQNYNNSDYSEIAIRYTNIQADNANTIWAFYSPSICCGETIFSIQNNVVDIVPVDLNLVPQSSPMSYWPHNIVVSSNGIIDIAYTACNTNTKSDCTLRYATYNPATLVWTDELVAQ